MGCRVSIAGLVATPHRLCDLITVFVRAGNALGNAPVAIVITIAIADLADRNALIADDDAGAITMVLLMIAFVVGRATNDDVVCQCRRSHGTHS
jgi:hypothetical protein